MNKNEIKKALYKEKPTATLYFEDDKTYSYDTTLLDESVIKFNVPISEMGENLFAKVLPAQLLIRWIE